VKTEQSTPTEADWLNFHHLRYFWAVAHHGSLRKAAEALRISQPSISAQLKLLESALGEPLFRRSGRVLVVTEFGRVIQGYADEIFRLGRELLTAGRRGHASQALRLHLGVVDSFPKLVSLDVLRPLLAQVPPVHVSCREGKIDDLLGQLAAHRLDALLADEPPPSGATVKTFTHELGGSGITFCAAPALARRLRGRFPRNLDGAPMLLPTPNTALRRDLETWFRSVGVSPVVIGEFEDAALAKIVATDGHGVTVVPTVVVADAMERYSYVSLGKTESCRMQLFLITAERRIEHPAVVLLARAAGQGSIGRAGANRSRRGTDSVRE
jgi:LysR family transcriptional activator of nhaA